MALIQLKNIHIAFGVAPILDGVNFALEAGERVCLIGRNGEGKSTLLKLISGQITPDEGEVLITESTKIAMLAQDVPQEGGSVLQTVMNGNPNVANLLAQYHQLSERCTAGDMNACTLMGDLQHQIDAKNGWELERFATTLIDNMGLDANACINELSGGRKRRVLLAAALVSSPDVLLLDEPTNHLDVESISWLENFLLSNKITVLFITHDRQFVDNLATRIIELDRGRLCSYDVNQGSGGYGRYLQLKELELASEQKSFAEFDKKLAQEEIWIRQGIKARRTRNEGRVRALKALREERKARREVLGNITLTQNTGEKSGKIVCTADNICLKYDNQILLKEFSTVLMRGDKVGIIGKNGVGKTTLIRTLLGLDNNALVSGKITLGTSLNIAFFDQLKEDLDPNQSVAENVGQGSDYVEIAGKKTHILGYLQDFLFTPNRSRTPVKALSGGEKARVLLAKQLLKPANVLVLDEPTNDLDMATLELLEDFVMNFEGTVLLISHDRAFMDNVATQTWVFGSDDNGDGIIEEYVGGYQDYLIQSERLHATKQSAVNAKAYANTQTNNKPNDKSDKRSPTKRKLSYKEKTELEALPKQIKALEAEQLTLQNKLADGSWFIDDLAAATAGSQRLGEIDDQILDKMLRLDELENL